MAVALFAILFCAHALGTMQVSTYKLVDPFNPIAPVLSARFPGTIVVATDRNVAFGLQHYCRKPGCAVTIVALKVPETFAADMAIGVVNLADTRNILDCRGQFITVARDPRDNPVPFLSKIANGTDLSANFSETGVLKVTQWRPKVPSAKPVNCDLTNRLIAGG